jgi:hypothetical protein
MATSFSALTGRTATQADVQARAPRTTVIAGHSTNRPSLVSAQFHGTRGSAT